MYKIQNSALEDDKAVFLAAAGLYEVIKNERILLAAAASFNITEIESSFNQIVASAVENYSVFTADVTVEPTQMEMELLTNFSDLFNLIIDIKK